MSIRFGHTAVGIREHLRQIGGDLKLIVNASGVPENTLVSFLGGSDISDEDANKLVDWFNSRIEA